jgi:chaperonin GroEL
MYKLVYKYSEVEDEVFEAIDIITDPIKQTLSPKGGNVIYEDDNGNQFVTNDGATIAKNISVENPVQNAIIEIIKASALKTNVEAGDGTSSTILLASILTKEGLRLVRDGVNQMEVKRELESFADKMKRVLEKNVRPIKTDEDIRFIAGISANNDTAIADDVVRIIKVVGEDGQVILDRGYTAETEIIEDSGFVLRSGLLVPEIGNKQHQSMMLDVPVIITDKRLYYKSEAETILKTVLENGYKEVVIVAADFIGEALPYFVANHQQNKVKVILVKENKLDILEDLATYLGGEVISDKKGSLVNNITIADFMMSTRVFSDPYKSIVSRDKDDDNTDIDKRVKMLKKEMKTIGNQNDSEYKKLQERVAAMTNGMVTLKVGGHTQLEVIEKLFRYEDAISAVRAAMKKGYLPGAGMSVYHAYKKIKVPSEYHRMFKKATEANIRQVAENSGKNPDLVLNTIDELTEEFGKETIGYNALTDKFEDVLEAGIIEPFLVTSNVIDNAVSIANVIITGRYLIVNDIEAIRKNKE